MRLSMGLVACTCFCVWVSVCVFARVWMWKYDEARMCALFFMQIQTAYLQNTRSHRRCYSGWRFFHSDSRGREREREEETSLLIESNFHPNQFTEHDECWLSVGMCVCMFVCVWSMWCYRCVNNIKIAHILNRISTQNAFSTGNYCCTAPKTGRIDKTAAAAQKQRKPAKLPYSPGSICS